MLQLRPAQEKILAYRHGKMAVSAVPGSGKTFSLSLLAAQLIAEGRINARSGQQILIVTYQNSSVDNFKTSIRDQLLALGLQPVGFEVRTLHSLSLEIVRTAAGGDSREEQVVLDSAQSQFFLGRAIDTFKEHYPDAWSAIVPRPDDPKWRKTIEKSAAAFITTAKNEQQSPDAILAALQKKISVDTDQTEMSGEWAFTWMLAVIYERYQHLLVRKAALDFDDQVWQAVDYLQKNPSLCGKFGERWPYILEDEAQDSVPLQATLLGLLTSEHGNLVRVGDPNQAINSTFTAAHPRFFNDFLTQDDVLALPLPNSGRCSRKIIGLANKLVDWVSEAHPLAEVRAHTFRQQHIEPTPPGDSQPNPPDDESNIVIRKYNDRETEEIPKTIRLAHLYMQKFPDRTVAILMTTNRIGQMVSDGLDDKKIPYDSLLKGDGRVRQIAAVLYALLQLLAAPTKKKWLIAAYQVLVEIEHPAVADPTIDHDKILQILNSVNRVENLLFPTEAQGLEDSLPLGRATPTIIEHLHRFGNLLRRLFERRALPVDDMVLAIGDELFAYQDREIKEVDLATVYQIGNLLRQWQDLEPALRLPELTERLGEVADGNRNLAVSGGNDGFEPRPGYITLATQHSAKGLEWDAVFLISIDAFWLPNDLDAYFLGVDATLGIDLTVEAKTQLRELLQLETGVYTGRDATESAHIDVISERFRLLYVAITRARRFLQISRSTTYQNFNKTMKSRPAEVVGVLYSFLSNQ